MLPGDPSGARTRDTLIKSQVLYQLSYTHRNLVEVKGLEPPAPWSQTKCATKLRYTSRVINVVDHQGLEPRTYRL